jgi:hypothetical protein
LGRSGNGFVKTDTVQDLAGDDTFAFAALHFGNADGVASSDQMTRSD